MAQWTWLWEGKEETKLVGCELLSVVINMLKQINCYFSFPLVKCILELELPGDSLPELFLLNIYT